MRHSSDMMPENLNFPFAGCFRSYLKCDFLLSTSSLDQPLEFNDVKYLNEVHY